jgi:hypothetical protein
MRPYREQVEQMVRALEEHPGIVVRHAEIRPPATEQQLATARTYALYRLPPGVAEFFRELNGFELEWETTAPGGETGSGSVNVVPVEQVFAGWEGTVWFPGVEGGERFREVKPFDVFTAEACAAFQQPPDEFPSEEVAVHYFGEDLCGTGFDFGEYVDLLLASRGYLYWQLALCAETADGGEASAFRERAPRLFPDLDPSRFRPKG